eukprot:m.75799 g.75799  ORF g.75799 m.75799 type:complete len:109 (+) comp50418_c0_seq1:1088-1414(+)
MGCSSCGFVRLSGKQAGRCLDLPDHPWNYQRHLLGSHCHSRAKEEGTCEGIVLPVRLPRPVFSHFSLHFLSSTLCALIRRVFLDREDSEPFASMSALEEQMELAHIKS